MVEFKTGDVSLERTELGHRLQIVKDCFNGFTRCFGLCRHKLHAVIALVVNIDSRVDFHRGIVAAAINVGDIAALDFQIGLIQLRKIGLILVNGDGGDGYIPRIFRYLVDIVCLFRVSSACIIFLILVFAVATAKKTTDGNPLVFNGLRISDFRRTASCDKSLPRVVDDVRLFIILFLCQT